ncbi:MAG: hypothetical protein IEMM0008_0050 [bacterium]|nr:MAG: hypothetical protein IEMM0008_0050 [bacterium]
MRENPRILVLIRKLDPSAEIRLVNVLRALKYPSYKIVESYRGLSRETIDDFISAHIIVFQRAFDPTTRKLFDLALQSGKVLLYDIDDDLLSLPENSLISLTHKDKERIIYFLSQSTYLMTSTQRLKEKYKSYNRRVRVIENTIDVHKWQRPSDKTMGKTRILLVSIDYFKLTVFKEPFIDLLEDLLELDHIELYIIGTVPSTDLLTHENVHSLGFIFPYEAYLRTVQDLRVDIALVPLEETDFHAYKSVIKFVEYSALGIAGVFSDVSPYNSDLIQDKINALIVDNTREAWEKAIHLLIEDSIIRKKLTDHAYQTVCQHYDIKYATQKWQALISEIEADGIPQLAHEEVESIKCQLIKIIRHSKVLWVLSYAFGGFRLIVRIFKGQVSLSHLFSALKAHRIGSSEKNGAKDG